jgi:hypothetical protein
MEREGLMRHAWMNRIGRWLVILLLALAGTLTLIAPVRADGDTVTLSTTNGTSFTYGGTKPSFTVVVNLGAKLTGNYFLTAYISIDGGAAFGSINGGTQSPDGLTLTFTGIKPDNTVAVGQHSAVARFSNPETGITSYSGPFTFTVNKVALDMACNTEDDDTLIGAGQPVGIQMSLFSGGPLPSEWLSGTYNVTFDGPSHVSYTNLTSDSNYVVTVTAPSQIGLYTLSCAFNGSASYTPASITSNSHYTISAMHGLGVVKLYTNPTTLASGRSADFYVEFHPASGLPIPTGQFSIWLGNHYTNAITLGPTGNYLIHFQTIPILAGVSRIEIFYMGDKYYNRAHVYFPLTNPPIPGGTNAGGSGNGSLGSGNNPVGTATAQGTPGVTATAGSDSATPTAVDAGNVAPTTHSASGDNGGLWLVVILALVGLVIVGGAVGAGIFLIRRTHIPADMGPQASRDFYAPPSYGPPGDGTWPPRYDER